MLFLQIIGGVAVFLIVAAVIIYYYIKIKFGKWLKAAEGNATPLVIHINKDLFPEWIEEKKAQSLVKNFIAQGFRVGAAYTIPEMDGVKLLSFYKEAYIGVLYTHPIAGLWVDLVAKYNDGSELTVTDMPMGAEISNRPEMKKVVMKGASIDEMVEQLYELTSGHSLKFIHEEDFRSFFEDAYKRDIQWRNRNGGISYEDFISVEQEMKKKHTDKHIKEAFLETKLQELDQWHHSVVEQYIEREQLKADDDKIELAWDSVIVPTKTDPVSYAYYLKQNGFINNNVNLEKLAEHFKGEANIQVIFNRLNNNLSPELRAKKAGTFDHPLPTDLYLFSERFVSEY